MLAVAVLSVLLLQDPALAPEVGARGRKLFDKFPAVQKEGPVLAMLAAAGVAVPFPDVRASLARFAEFQAERTMESAALTRARLEAFSLIAGTRSRASSATRDRSFSEKIVKVSENNRLYD
jgi:hypothetical protein